LLCCLWTKTLFAAGIDISVSLPLFLILEYVVMDGQKHVSSHCDSAKIQVCDPQGFFREVLKRLPLADAVFHLLGYALNEEFLSACYEKHRGHCYEDTLSFPRLVEILTDALLVHHGSARQALLEAKKKGTLPTCKEAFYGKLRRLPLGLSVAFMTEASRRLNELLPVQDNPLPASLHAYQVRIIDGKKTKHIAKKLKLTRDQAGQLFGSKLLAGYDPATRLIQTVAAHPDGEKNDAPLVPDLLANLHAQTTGKPTIIVADAQFCDLVQMDQYRKKGDFFVLRYHPKIHFHADATMPRRAFTDAKGRALIEEYGWLGSPTDKRRRFVRRVTWKRTDHKDLSVVTDLSNRQPAQNADTPESIPAADLIDLYLIRWRIETVFQDVTVVFGLRKLIGSTPEATAFQAAFCMVVYNGILVVKSYLAAVQPKPMPVDDVSNTMLFISIRKQLTALAELVPAAPLAELVVRPSTAEDARRYLRERLTGLWETGWKKATNKNPRRYTEKKKGSGAHTSVYRVLQKHKQAPKAGNESG
jgi:Transposase DDE domain